MNSPFTNCITNFARLDHLKTCLNSLEIAKKKPAISLASYAATEEHELLGDTLLAGQMKFFTEKDYGCNRLWMQAIAMARTPWVSILHDDDLRPANFQQIAEGLIATAEAKHCGFIAWNGLQYDCATKTTSGRIPIAAGVSGVHESVTLIPMLKAHNSLPNSPVSFMFNRETCLDVLSWCEDNLNDCVTKPTMMVGNDVALVVGHCQRYPRFLQCESALSLYGHWDGSETIAWNQGKNKKLMDCYNTTRKRLFDKVVFPRRRHKLFIHVTISGPTITSRQELAWKTWKKAFEKLGTDYIPVPLHLQLSDLPRTSSKIGDTRSLGFIRDIIQAGRNMGDQGDIVVLSNDDVCVNEDCFVQIAAQAEKYGATFCHRRDFFEKFDQVKTHEEVKKGHWHAGLDVVAMTGKWWDEVGKPNLPDFIIGCEAWDWAMRWIITYTTGQYGFKNNTYHEYHGGWWEHPDNRFSNVSNLHNRSLAKWWMTTHGSYNGEFDGRTMPLKLNVEPKGCDDNV